MADKEKITCVSIGDQLCFDLIRVLLLLVNVAYGIHGYGILRFFLWSRRYLASGKRHILGGFGEEWLRRSEERKEMLITPTRWKSLAAVQDGLNLREPGRVDGVLTLFKKQQSKWGDFCPHAMKRRRDSCPSRRWYTVVNATVKGAVYSEALRFRSLSRWSGRASLGWHNPQHGR